MSGRGAIGNISNGFSALSAENGMRLPYGRALLRNVVSAVRRSVLLAHPPNLRMDNTADKLRRVLPINMRNCTWSLANFAERHLAIADSFLDHASRILVLAKSGKL